jgi:hypothetical protein
MLKAVFNWKNSDEEADMLAAVLIVVRKYHSTRYLTPARMLINLLNHSGRSSYASAIAAKLKLPLNSDQHLKFTSSAINEPRSVPQRDDPISNDYFVIAEKLLR